MAAIIESSTTIVNVNAEMHEKFVAFLSETIGVKIDNLNNVEEFSSLVVKNCDKLINTMEEEDVEGCFQVLFKDIQLETNPAVVGKLVQELTQAVSSNTDSKVVLRMKILANMYNVLSAVVSSTTPSVFVVLLRSIINYAGKVGQMDKLHNYFNNLDELVLKWGLSAKEARDLFLQVSNALEAQGQEQKAQVFLIRYLSTFDSSEGVDAEEKKLAAQCMVGAVKNPIVCFMERHDIVGLRGVASLKEDKEHGKLFELLSIFSTGKLSDYMNFYTKNDGAALLAKYPGLSHEEVVGNMRLLTMCSLATEHSEIPYAAIAKDLDIPLEEVEAWVVRTISAKLIDAKMDQLTQRVMISRCTHRIFGKEQWKELQAKLHSWKANLRGILDTLAKTDNTSTA